MAKDQDENLFTIESEAKGSYYLVRPRGRLVSKNILSARKVLDEALEKKHTRILVDLTSVEYMDSMGIGLFVSFNKKVKEAKGLLVLAGPNRTVADIFTVSGTSTFLTVCQNLADAAQAFA